MPLLVPIALLLLSQVASYQDPAPTLTAPLTAPACPADRSPDDITVCGRRNDGSGYRLPPPDRFDPAGSIDSVSRERHRLLDVGASGIGSCSTVGPGGWTGCMLNDWRNADEQWAGRNHGHGPRMSLRVGSVNRDPHE
jgi:hypothetical protein